MKILAIYDGSGPKYHRILLPVSLMPEVELTIHHTITDENADCDILFFNRTIAKTTLNQVLKYRDQYGFTMICDLDDHWKLSPGHILYDVYAEHSITELIKYYILESDHITVTHDRLADEVKALGKPVTILPNAIPSFGQFTYPKTASDKTRLFWAGGVTHEKDLEILRNPIKRMKDLPVKMVIGGYAANPVFMRMASAFTNGGRMDNKLIEALPVDQYYAMFSECDISLIPLEVSTFNMYKSNLKILEAANVAAPVVVSKVHPYLGFPDHLVNYVERQSDWNRHVRRLLANPEEAAEQGKALQAYCREQYNFTEINKQRLTLFKQYAPTRQIQGEAQTVDQ